MNLLQRERPSNPRVLPNALIDLICRLVLIQEDWHFCSRHSKEHKHVQEPASQGSVRGRRSAAKLVCRREGDEHRRESRRGRDGLWCRAASRSNVVAAVHLAAVGQADHSVCAGHIHPGGGAGGCVTV